MNKRRRILLAAAGSAIAPAIMAQQAAAKIYRIGVVADLTPAQQRAFEDGLRSHEWIAGKNVVIDYRTGAVTSAQVGNVARELIASKVDCFVSAGDLRISALKPFTDKVPLVMAYTAEAVKSGFVADLRRPGGNITGISNVSEALTGKRIELLRDFDARINHVGILKSPVIAAHESIWKDAQSSARSIGVKVSAFDYRSVDELDAAIRDATKAKVQALLVPQSPITAINNTRLLDLIAKAHLLAIYQSSSYVTNGGLISYGPDEIEMWRHAPDFVDKIFKGIKPADIPVEQPTKFELAVNTKAARTLGLSIPQSIALRADKVIQ